MPTYQFYCEQCNLKFEKFMKMADATWHTKCDKCGGESDRVITAPMIKKNTDMAAVDRIIGAESEKRHEDIKAKKQIKDKIRKESGNHAVETVFKKDESGKINYEYKTVSKERLEERKKLYAEYESSKKDKK
jgi:putative FmdB family regulatory protein